MLGASLAVRLLSQPISSMEDLLRWIEVQYHLNSSISRKWNSRNSPAVILKPQPHSHPRSDYNLLVSNGTSVMRYFSDAPPGTVQRMLYETKIQNLPARVRGLNDAEAIKLMASGKLPAKTGSRNKKICPRLRETMSELQASSRNLAPMPIWYFFFLNSSGRNPQAAKAPLPMPSVQPWPGLQGDWERYGLQQALALHQDIELLLPWGTIIFKNIFILKDA